MPDRETKQITTPAGKVLTLKAYLNAGERNQIRKVYLDKANYDPSVGIKNIPASVLDDIEKKLIEVVIVSYDGIIENIYQTIIELDPAEYDFIVAEANKASTGNFQSAK